MSNRKQLVADITPFGVRLPDGLRERIKAAAASNNRSMNAEVVARIAATFGAAKDFGLASVDRTPSPPAFKVTTIKRAVLTREEAEAALRAYVGAPAYAAVRDNLDGPGAVVEWQDGGDE